MFAKQWNERKRNREDDDDDFGTSGFSEHRKTVSQPSSYTFLPRMLNGTSIETSLCYSAPSNIPEAYSQYSYSILWLRRRLYYTGSTTNYPHYSRRLGRRVTNHLGAKVLLLTILILSYSQSYTELAMLGPYLQLSIYTNVRYRYLLRGL